MKFKQIFIVGTIAFCSFGYSQVKISANCQSDLWSIQESLEIKQEINYSDLINKFPVNKIDNQYYVNLLFKVGFGFSRSQIESYGAMVGGRSQDILSVKWPIEQLSFLTEINNVEIIQVAQKVKPTLSRVRFDTRVDSVHAGIGLSNAFTGKNVLIGITDWGFDYTSPMFYDTLLQNTRILSAWDQFKTAGPHPAGYSYGTEYNSPSDLILAGADTANIYSYATHGSHVAGIAGGSGAGTEYRGIAFEAQYLMATFLVDEGAVLDAWQWMYDKAQAEGKRLVVNMSWGLYHTGALDGTSLLSQALDNFSQQGVVFVTSAGNNGDESFHIKYDFMTDTMKTRINFYTGAVNNLWGQSVHSWGEPGQSFDCKLKVLGTSNQLLAETAWYSTATTLTYIDTFMVIGNDSVFYNISADASYPTNNCPQMRIRVKKQPATYRVVLESTSATGTVHYWNVTELSSDVGNWGMPFSSLGTDFTVGDEFYSLGAPACTQSAITVASHVAEYEAFNGNIVGGARSNFSSIGPLITGEMKPDISAPGQNVASSISSYTDNSFNTLTSVSFNGRIYPFSRFSGTSMSSPAVAGIAALLLEANPNLSPMQVKQIIMQTARLDDETGPIGPVGDEYWGAGKANAYKAIKKALNTVGELDIVAPMTWKVYPNPATHTLFIDGLDETVMTIQIINLSGQVVQTHENVNQINVSDLPNGFYLIRLVNSNFGAEQQAFIIE